MSSEEKTSVTEQTKPGLLEIRENKHYHTKNLGVAAFNDKCATVAAMAKDLDRLYLHTGYEGLLMIVRPDVQHHGQPFVMVTSNAVTDFFNSSIGRDPRAIANQLEAFLVSGVGGEAS